MAGVSILLLLLFLGSASGQWQIEVEENTPSGTTLHEITLEIGDIPQDQIVYSLADDKGYNNRFTFLDNQLILIHRLDYEEHTHWTLIIEARLASTSELIAEGVVTINVHDVNDHAPVIIANTLTTSGDAEIEENSAVGSFIAVLTVEDQDSGANGEVTCALDPNEEFQLVQLYGTEYKIVSAVLFDRELQDTYSHLIRCRDNGSPQMSAHLMITVHVVDVNDNVPIVAVHPVSEADSSNVIQMETFSPPNQLLAHVQTRDDDAGPNAIVDCFINTEIFALEHVDGGEFSLLTRYVFDREYRSEVEVMCADRGAQPLSATATVTVEVTGAAEGLTTGLATPSTSTPTSTTSSPQPHPSDQDHNELTNTGLLAEILEREREQSAIQREALEVLKQHLETDRQKMDVLEEIAELLKSVVGEV